MNNRLIGVVLALAAGALAMSAATQASAADLKSWQRQIAQTVASKQVYPRSALRREIEGSAKVRVTVAPDGKIASFEVLEETGHEVLDREIVNLMERIDPLPKPPEGTDADALTFILPLAWVLR